MEGKEFGRREGSVLCAMWILRGDRKRVSVLNAGERKQEIAFLPRSCTFHLSPLAVESRFSSVPASFGSHKGFTRCIPDLNEKPSSLRGGDACSDSILGFDIATVWLVNVLDTRPDMARFLKSGGMRQVEHRRAMHWRT